MSSKEETLPREPDESSAVATTDPAPSPSPSTHQPSPTTPLPLSSSSSEQPPRFYLILVNIQKYQNVAAMIRGAIAFGCRQVLLVGSPNILQRLMEKEAGITNNENKEELIPQLKHFVGWKECVEYIKSNEMHVIGVEIDETSKPLNDEYFDKHFPSEQQDIALLMGNEANGILPKFQAVCSSLIRIPQFGDGTASLNVNVAASIVLHRFCTWKRTKIQNETKK